MISRIRGTLLTRDLERVEVLTAGGVVYEVEIPLTVLERLPPAGADVELRTVQVVREDSVTLYGFLELHERELFLRLLSAAGVGPRLAVAMLSALSARRLARALAEGDVATLKQVSGVGRRTAERLVLELAEKVADLALPEAAPAAGPGADEAVRALVALGYSVVEAEEAVRGALLEGDPPGDPEELVRRALARVG